MDRIGATIAFLLLIGFCTFSAGVDGVDIKKLTAALGFLPASTLQQWQQQGGFKVTLSEGSKGGQVSLLQKAFASDQTIYNHDSITGYFGKRTKAATLEFQRQYGLPTTGLLDLPTREALNVVFFGALCPQSGDTSIDLFLQPVNKNNPLPTDYIPPNLVDISGTIKSAGIQCVTKPTASALENMFIDAARDRIYLGVTSGYRRPEIQQLTLEFWLAVEGEQAFNEVALPYHSEHQLGTAVDLSGQFSRFESVRDDFDKTPEGQWLLAHAYKYGFVLSYPKNILTGYNYEPWHWRYVGNGLARLLHTRRLTFNEYFEDKNAKNAAIVEDVVVKDETLF